MASRRVWIPIVLAAICLVAANWAGPIMTWVLVLSGFGLLLDGVTAWWARSGGLTQHRQ